MDCVTRYLFSVNVELKSFVFERRLEGVKNCKNGWMYR